MKIGTAVLMVLSGVVLGINAQQPRPPPDPPIVYPGRYMILAGNTIRPGMPLTLSVSIFETEGGVPVNFNAAILRDNAVVVSTMASLQVGTSQVTLEVPVTAIAVGEYSLHVIATGGLEINETRSLYFSIDHFSIFVQSDKAIYKPGQTVRYRIMAVYPDLKPYVGPFTVRISDANGNVIEQMINKQPNKNGIISEEMVMSDYPVLGDWVIKAEAEGQSKEYTFKIDEYVLPKFEVSITVPPWIDGSYKNKDVRVTVTAKYTFGKPVEGSATLGGEIAQTWGNNYRQFRKTKQLVDGEAHFDIPLRDLLALKRTGSYEPTWYEGENRKFTANVTETLTGITQGADEAILQYYNYPVKVVFQESITRSNHKPGLPYHVYLVVSHQDGTPLTEAERMRGVVLWDCRRECWSSTAEWNQQSLSIASQTGVAEAFIQTTMEDSNMQLRAEYNGAVDTPISFPPYARPWGEEVSLASGQYISAITRYLDRASSDSNTFIQVNSSNPGALTIGTLAAFRVQSTSAPGKLTYQIVARGNIIEAETITGVGTDHTINKMITEEMSPKSKFIVYFLTESGEVVLDSLEFVVNVVFSNPVSASFSRDRAEPGTSVSFDVETTPGAFVGVLAIDKSVLLLADGNDITHNQVLESVGRFDTTQGSSWDYNPFFDIAFCFYPFPTSGDNAGRILKNAGIVYITDGNVVYVERDRFWGRGYAFDNVPMATPGAAFPRGIVYMSDGNLLYEETPIWWDFDEVLEEEAMPVAGFPQADGAIPEAGVNNRQNDVQPVPEKKIRKEFPETWLWVDTEADSAGRVSIQTNFPDTITSWVGTAISMDGQAGLGVTQDAAMATVFKPFFVSLNLPYSVIRGESFALQASIFNYLETDVTATIELQSSPDYNIIFEGNEIKSSTPRTREVRVGADSGVSVSFAVEPLKNGMIELVVTASAGGEQDGVRRLLLVEPEGVAQEYVVSELVNFGNINGYTKTFSLDDLPKNEVVADSIRAEITATGDILGPTMNNLDQLLRMPSGCGEQTMISFAPDVFIYKYLKETNQSNPTIEQKALNFMKKGYQRELTYQHEDGSFSAWGDSGGDDGSTWLTAFVVRSFLQASPYIYIDPARMEQAMTFLIDHQAPDGTFLKSGRIVDQGIEGGVSSRETLTAYCAIAMDQARQSDILSDATRNNAQRALDNAMTYLVSRYTSVQDDKYAMAIITYALSLGGSPNLAMFRTRLDELQTVEDEGRLRYWTDVDSQTSPANDDFYYWAWRGPPSTAIEMTGYGMLAYLATNDVTNSIPVAGWLSQQRNSLGGYSSTQDTVIALLALTTYAERVSSDSKNMNLAITASADPTYNQEFTITNQNSILLQQFELPVDTGTVTVQGTGMGSFLLSFILHYNLPEVTTLDIFEITITELSSDPNSFEIRACGQYTRSGEGTGMAIMDIGIPSGFYVEEDALVMAIKEHPFATKHEIMGTSVVIYLNEIPSTMQTCITINGKRANTVAGIKPSVVKVYSYYTPEEQSVTSYSVRSLRENNNICNLCPECCSDSGGRASVITTSPLLLIVLTFFSFLGALVM